MSTPSPDSSPPAPTRNARLSADDWAQAALDLIAEQGVSAVAVEPLARRLGVTKGSFYWHFPSRDALLQAALERWEAVEQESIFGSLEQVADPRERLRALFQLVGHEVKPHIIYSELLKALDHPPFSRSSTASHSAAWSTWSRCSARPACSAPTPPTVRA